MQFLANCRTTLVTRHTTQSVRRDSYLTTSTLAHDTQFVYIRENISLTSARTDGKNLLEWNKVQASFFLLFRTGHFMCQEV